VMEWPHPVREQGGQVAHPRAGRQWPLTSPGIMVAATRAIHSCRSVNAFSHTSKTEPS
jgi:hypothetical protein